MSPLYPVRSRQIAARMFDGEMMIMSSQNATLFNLDDVGSVIWAAADGRTSLEEIVVNRICTQYEVAPEVALPDAESFVRELAAQGILELSETPVAEEGSRQADSSSVSSRESGSQVPGASRQEQGDK